jgi:crotonobetainyl-CoA:carnitine CoA-transferase CaiB-like acyl-CoA transferase
VYCSITGFGQDGPRAEEPGYDAAIQALSGLMAMTGEPDRPPVKLGVAWVDVLAGLHAAVAILAALRERDRTGMGAHLDLALFDVSLAALVNQAQGALLTGERPDRLGSGHPNIVPYQAFETHDGALMLAVGNDLQFRRLCEVLDRPAWADDVRFATNPARVEHRDLLVPGIAARLRERTRADPQAVARGAVDTIAHPAAGAVPMLTSPLRYAGATAQREAPPVLGQHTREVLAAALGMDATELAELVDQGAIAED